MLNILRNKFVILFLLFSVLVRVSDSALEKIQYESNVLGLTATQCSGKLDLNCDSRISLKDVQTATMYVQALKSAPTTTTDTTTATQNTTAVTTTTDTSSSKDSGTSTGTKPTDPTTPPPTPTKPPSGGGTTPPPPTTPPTPPVIPTDGSPYPGAPECPESAHSINTFHTLWNSTLRCHYNHEHGQNPFTSEVANTFPGFNLKELLGNVEVGHTNLSSPMENTHKHGGFKWQATLRTPQNCDGFEGSTHGVNAAAIQYHNFGDYSIELEANVHTASALLRQCNSSNPTDYGYIYTTQFQNYGQVVVPYQGTVFNYPHTPQPAYVGAFGPYLTVNCIGDVPQCRSSLAVAQRNNASTNWSSKPTGRGTRPQVSSLFKLFFRARDTYQNFAWNDQVYPFTFIWLCTSDGGRTYDPRNCRYNNTTTQVHEIAGEIPAAWDNLSGFDTNPRVGRVTASGYTTKYGVRNPSCTAAGPDCHPIKLVNALVGTYGSVLFFTDSKGTNLTPLLPERDIYFCNGVLCNEGAAGATPSGWVGATN